MTAPRGSPSVSTTDDLPPSLHAMVSAAFAEALSLDPGSRDEVVAALRRQCDAAGVELEHWLRLTDLLGDEHARGFLNDPIVRVTSLSAPTVASTAADSATSSDLPSQIGPYRILREAGRGAYARVFLAEHPSPRRQVALKLLASGLDGRDILARFDRERHALARLQHPSIASLFEVGLWDGAPYFVMEWVNGEPLVGFAVTRGLDLITRLRLFAQLCRAVQHAHERGIIHRDLKPSNVLAYQSQGGPAIKVIDFGVAKAVQSDGQGSLGDLSLHTFAGMLVGTPPYMSPELLDGHANLADTRCDIYSLGAILFELLTGQRLIGGRGSTLADYRRLARDRPAITLARGLLSMSRARQRDLEAVIERAASPCPEDRYRSAGDLCEDVEHLLAGRPARARAISRAESVRRAIRAHPIATGIGVGTVVGVISLIVALSARLQTAEVRAKLWESTVSTLWSAEQLAGKMGVEEERGELQRSALLSARELVRRGDADRDALLLLARALQGAQEAENADADRTSGDTHEAHLAAAMALSEEHLAVRKAIAAQPDATLEDAAAEAVALVLVGNRHECAQRYDLARRVYEEAMGIEESLLEQRPDHPLLLSRLSYSCERLGVLANRRGEWQLERDYVRQRMTIARHLTEAYPDDHNAQLNLAEARRFVLATDDITGERFAPLSDGDAICQEQLGDCRRLAREHPACVRSQREYAMALASAARRMVLPDQAPARVASLTEAQSVLREAIVRQPNDPMLLDPLSAIVSDLAQESEWAGDLTMSLVQLREQHEILERLIASRPHEAIYRKAIAICERRIATLSAAQ